MKQKGRQKNIIVMGVAALGMLVAMMGVIVSGLMQVTDGVRIAVVEDRNTSDVIAKADYAQGEVDESGRAVPLGETKTSRPDKTVAMVTVMNIQMALLGVVGVGVVAILILMWRGMARNKQ